jgi:hypothetical protein
MELLQIFFCPMAKIPFVAAVSTKIPFVDIVGVCLIRHENNDIVG